MTKQATRTEHMSGHRWRLPMWTAIAVLLLLPLLAMRFTTEVVWTASDFVAAAILLVGGGVLFELVARRLRRPSHRAMAGGVIIVAVALVWAEGAVGIL